MPVQQLERDTLLAALPIAHFKETGILLRLTLELWGEALWLEWSEVDDFLQTMSTSDLLLVQYREVGTRLLPRVDINTILICQVEADGSGSQRVQLRSPVV